MKKYIVFALLILMVVLTACGSDEKEESSSEGTDQSEVISKSISELVDEEKVVEINEIKVVENHAEESAGGYNAMVHLVFNEKNRANTAKETTNAITDRLGANLSGTEELENITFFWEVPYLLEGDNIIKIEAKHEDEKMYRVDEWYDGRIFE